MTQGDKQWTEAEVADLLRQASDYVESKVRELTLQVEHANQDLVSIARHHDEIVAAYEEQLQTLIREACA